MEINPAWHHLNMRKIILYCALATTFSTACRTQLIRSKHETQLFPTGNKALFGVKGPYYKGTVFAKEYPSQNLFIYNIDSVRRFTPSVEEIQIVEHLLHHNLTTKKSKSNKQLIDPFIRKNLAKYFRQYVGFIDKRGNKIIHVNFHWNRWNIIDKINNYIYFNDSRISYDSDYSMVMDGGHYYWRINANITQKKLTDLAVNGVG
jgi:hypothetical protein